MTPGWGRFPWRRKWQPPPVFLPFFPILATGKPHGWRSLVGYSPWSRKELDTTERLHFHFQTMVQVMKIMATSFRRSHAGTAILSAPNPPAGHCRLMPLLETPGHSQTNLGQCLVGSLLLSLGYWCTRFCLCPPRVYFPVLCNFWLLCGGVNGALLQEGLFHAQVCCACLCSSPLLTHTSTGDAQRQFCLSLCEVSGSWCA